MKINNVSGMKITLLHNDTLSEINPMEFWARKFMNEFKEKVEALGNHVEIKIVTPPPIDTFYWRVFVRGYVAPTYNFRWCVNLLKRKPTERAINNGTILLVGLREDESATRKNIMRRNYGSCPLSPSKCLGYYFMVNDMRKVAPLRDWRTADVWEYLRKGHDIGVDDLLFLYGCEEARYGCWHCTLVKVQWGLRVLDERYMYFEALRVLYRKISDLPELRYEKNKGYSSLGGLNKYGRSIFYHALGSAEELSGVRVYGLDESKVGDYSLREIFYELDSDVAMKIILSTDVKLPRERVVHIGDIRRVYKKKMSLVLPKIINNVDDNVKKYLLEILNNIIQR